VRRHVTIVIGVLVLGAVGFAAASIVSGESASSAETTGSTTVATVPQTVTVTTTNATTQTVTKTVPRRPLVLLCHRTAKGRFATITLRLSVSALTAHLRHGDLAGRCTAAKIRLIKKHLGRRR
jgi:hypothetical protein